MIEIGPANFLIEFFPQSFVNPDWCIRSYVKEEYGHAQKLPSEATIIYPQKRQKFEAIEPYTVWQLILLWLVLELGRLENMSDWVPLMGKHNKLWRSTNEILLHPNLLKIAKVRK